MCPISRFSKIMFPAALAAATVAVASCTGSQGDTPHAQPTSTAGSAQTPATSLTAARPRALNLNGTDPCKLLVEHQLVTFNVDRPARPGAAGGNSLLSGSP